MKYQEEKVINLLIDLVNEELDAEKEYNECANIDYATDLLNAKIWLMRKKKLLPIIMQNVIEQDVGKYFKIKQGKGE